MLIKHNENQWEIAPDLISIKSNVDHIHYYSFGTLYNYSNTKTKIDLEFYVCKDIDLPKNINKKFHFYYAFDEENLIYYERPLLMGITAKLLMTETQNGFKIIVNEAYNKYVRLRLDNILPPGVHLTDLTCISLLKINFAPLYSASISLDDECVLIVGPPKSGKTILCLWAANNNFKFMSEDITIIDGEYAYSCPFTATFLHKEFAKHSPPFPYINKVPEFLLYFLNQKKNKLNNQISNYNLQKKSKISKIIVLGKGEAGVQKMGINESFEKILLLNRYRFSYSVNPLLLAYSYLTDFNGITNLMKLEEELIKKTINNSDTYYVTAEDSTEYPNLMNKILGDVEIV